MKSEPKAFASLSSGLLARKGSARPAMRPQGFGQGGSLEDLGWNDMGHETPQPTLMPVDGAEFGGHSEPQVSRTPLAGLTPVSPVHHQQAEIEERFGYGDEEGEKAEELAWEAEASAEEPHEDDTLELADELPEAMPVAEAISEPEAMFGPGSYGHDAVNGAQREPAARLIAISRVSAVAGRFSFR